MKYLAIFALVAVANAGVLLPQVANLPLTRTTVEGPSGKIVKEESAPVVAYEETYLETVPEAYGVVEVARSAPLIPNAEVLSEPLVEEIVYEKSLLPTLARTRPFVHSLVKEPLAYETPVLLKKFDPKPVGYDFGYNYGVGYDYPFFGRYFI